MNYKFPSRTITYHDGTGSRYKKEVAAAAAAWNKSGAKVRWVKASKTRARVPIRVSDKIPAAGLAWYFGNGRGRIDLRSNLKKGQLTELAGRGVATQVIVHEMGHIMGLDHETGTCAIMQPALGGGCRRAPEIWQFRCRLLEKDDVRGGVALFGGRVGKVGPEFCDAVPQPAAVTGLAVEPLPPDETGFDGATVRWTTPKGKELEDVRVFRRQDVCPAGPSDKQAQFVASEPANAGRSQSTIDASGFPATSRYCYAVVVFGKFGRPGKIATSVYDHTGPPSEEFRPTADFQWEPAEDERTIVFTDHSYVNEGRIVAWHWDFADGSTSSERNPTHRFEPGHDYSVTLTVTDDEGRTGTVTRVVSIPEPVVETESEPR